MTSHQPHGGDPRIRLLPVAAGDLEMLADLRVAAMRESLERVGRFDPTRARERLRSSFSPEHTRSIRFEDNLVGFYAIRPTPEGLQLDHLYVHPDYQGRRIGAVVLETIFALADQRGQSVFVGALKGSDSNRFYQRHGFVQNGESEWDVYYVRLPSAG